MNAEQSQDLAGLSGTRPPEKGHSMTMMKYDRGQSEVAVYETPEAVIRRSTEWAKALMDIVSKLQLYQEYNGHKHLVLEAWQTIGRFDRQATARTVSTTPIIEEGQIAGYEATVEIVRMGEIIGSAIGDCYLTESVAVDRDKKLKGNGHNAARSMAQTRAASKAFRMCYSFVAKLAGYEGTPAEEMSQGGGTPTPETAERGMCPTHHVPFLHRQGTSKAGKAYGFWACPEKAADGGYCQERPAEATPAAKPSTDTRKAPQAPPAKASEAQQPIEGTARKVAEPTAGQREARALLDTFLSETVKLGWGDTQRADCLKGFFPAVTAGWKSLTIEQKREAVERLNDRTVALRSVTEAGDAQR